MKRVLLLAFFSGIATIFGQNIVAVPNPGVMVLSQDQKTLYIAQTSGTVSAIDVVSRQLIASISVNANNADGPGSIFWDNVLNAFVVPVWNSPTEDLATATTYEVALINPGDFSVTYLPLPIQPFFGHPGTADKNGLIYVGSNLFENESTEQQPAAPKIAILNPETMSSQYVLPGLIPIQYIGTGDGENLLAVFLTGGSDGAIAFIKNGTASSPVELPIAVYNNSPTFSPDGKTGYIIGPGTESTSSGLIAFDMVNQQISPVNTQFAGAISLNFSGSESNLTYVLWLNGVETADFSGHYFNGWDDPVINNDNQQLLIVRNQFTDTLIVLEANQVFFEDVQRSPYVSAVVDGASFQTTALSPNSWFSVMGHSLSFQSTQGTYPFPQTLDTARVALEYNGKTVYPPLYFASPDQLNVLVPADVSLGSTMTVIAQTQNADGTWTSSKSMQTTIAATNPGIFAVTPTLSAPGNTITLWCNGLGPISEPVVTGEAAPLDHLVTTVSQPVVMIGGQPAQVIFSGLAPGSVGLYQVNASVPQGLSGGPQPITISIGGVTSAATQIQIQTP